MIESENKYWSLVCFWLLNFGGFVNMLIICTKINDNSI